MEGVVIVASILLAFGIDAWWDGVQERERELGYTERLKEALVADTSRFAGVLEGVITVKLAVLGELQSARGEPPHFTDADTMMFRLQVSAFTQLPEARSEVFREMENSGALGLLRDPTLREGLAIYYARHQFMSGILDQSPGRYTRVLEDVLPGGLWYATRTDSMAVDPRVLDRGLRAMVSHPDLQAALNSEMRYASSLMSSTQGFKAEAAGLLRQLAVAYPK